MKLENYHFHKKRKKENLFDNFYTINLKEENLVINNKIAKME